MNWMWGFVVPIVGVLLEFLRLKKGAGTKTVLPGGVPETTVGKVGAAVENYLTRDERVLQADYDETERARRHDVDMGIRVPAIDVLRGLVRPVITLTAFFWYVYARVSGIEMMAEDYAIIGGVVAFWFGFRPFEKIGGPSGSLRNS